MAGLAVAGELIVRGWDVARGRAAVPRRARAAGAARSFLEQSPARTPRPAPDVLFGPARQVPDDASPFDRVIALAGRDRAWASG
jgi:hypothetical protein